MSDAIDRLDLEFIQLNAIRAHELAESAKAANDTTLPIGVRPYLLRRVDEASAKLIEHMKRKEQGANK